MACVSQTLAGLIQDCENSKGGIKKVYIATENPKPISATPINLNLGWDGFTIERVGDNKYIYSEDLINLRSSTSITVHKGDVVEITLPALTLSALVTIAIGNSYGPGREILEIMNYNVTVQSKKYY